MILFRWIFRLLQPLSPAAAAWLAERVFFTARRKALPAGARKFLASGRRFTTRVDGRRVVGWRWGDPDAPAVYLVHGWGSRGGRLAAFVEPLIAAGHAVVTYDALGNGASARGLTSMPEFARTLAAVVSHHGTRPPYAIIAHSMGCAATALALSWGLDVERLVFLAPAADPPAWIAPFARALGLRPDVVARLRARSERRLRVKWADLNVCDIARNLLRRPPLLIVHDDGDETVRWEDGTAIAAAWPESRLVTTQGLGHRGVTNDAGIVRQAVEFVTAGTRASRGRAWEQTHMLEHEMFYREQRQTRSMLRE